MVPDPNTPAAEADSVALPSDDDANSSASAAEADWD